MVDVAGLVLRSRAAVIQLWWYQRPDKQSQEACLSQQLQPKEPPALNRWSDIVCTDGCLTSTLSPAGKQLVLKKNGFQGSHMVGSKQKQCEQHLKNSCPLRSSSKHHTEPPPVQKLFVDRSGTSGSSYPAFIPPKNSSLSRNSLPCRWGQQSLSDPHVPKQHQLVDLTMHATQSHVKCKLTIHWSCPWALGATFSCGTTPL